MKNPLTFASSQWTSVLDAERANAAIAIATDVAHRAVDQRRTAEALDLARRQTQFPELGHLASLFAGQR